MARYISFILIYGYFSNYYQVNTFLRAVLSSRASQTVIHDSFIEKTIKEKTGLSLKKLIIFETKRMFGLMPGTPLNPVMIISRGMYEKMEKNELEWVILHEAGHCVLWHTVKCAIAEVVLGVIGLLVVSRLTILESFIVSILFALLFIRFARITERQADDFAAIRVTDPKKMISGTLKLKASYPLTSWYPVFRSLFGWNISHEERIAIAQTYIKN